MVNPYKFIEDQIASYGVEVPKRIDVSISITLHSMRIFKDVRLTIGIEYP